MWFQDVPFSIHLIVWKHHETLLRSLRQGLSLAFNGDSVWKQHQYHTWSPRSSSQNSLGVDVTHIFLAVSHGDPEYWTYPHMFSDQYQLLSDRLPQLIKIFKFYRFLLCFIIAPRSEKGFLWTASNTQEHLAECWPQHKSKIFFLIWFHITWSTWLCCFHRCLLL